MGFKSRGSMNTGLVNDQGKQREISANKLSRPGCAVWNRCIKEKGTDHTQMGEQFKEISIFPVCRKGFYDKSFIKDVDGT